MEVRRLDEDKVQSREIGRPIILLPCPLSPSSSDAPFTQRHHSTVVPLIGSDTVESPGCADPMHILFITSRSLDRYKEGETMLKSLLFHRERGEMEVGVYRQLYIHIVTDPSGQAYYEQMLSPYRISPRYNSASRIYVVYHDYQEVCVRPLKIFLSALHDMKMSFHHSGAAGYCRLFLPDYFLNPPTDASYPAPSGLIVLETDQLVLSPIEELWDHLFLDKMGIFRRPDMGIWMGAVENYQPWMDSRPNETPSKDGRNETHSSGRPYALSSTVYHGKLC